MGKYQKKKSSLKKEVIKEIRKTKRNVRKELRNKGKTNKRKGKFSLLKGKKRSLSHKSHESNLTYSSEIIEGKKYPILLPNEILSGVKDKLGNNCENKNLYKAINKHDVDEDIVYNYLDKCDKIDSENMKYLYTLSYKNRKKIIDKHKIKNNIFNKTSKMLFFEFIQFVSTKFEPNEESSLEELESYKLDNFDKYIIPIREGTNELKYYYFIDIIYKWIKEDGHGESAKNYLNYFYADYFSDKKNLNRIEEIFYILFRIDLLFLNKTPEGETILKSVVPSVSQKLEDIKEGLRLIQDKIKEDINDIKITRRTSLTLKKENKRFKPFYYVYSNQNSLSIIDNIKYKKYMRYEYFLKNKFNVFDSEKEINAFVEFVNKILKSNVIKEYYSKVEFFKNYEFPFERKEIVDHLWEKVIFTDLDEFTWGITNREGFGIFINRNKGRYEFGLGYGTFIITVSHEFIGHFIKYLINSNEKLLASTPTPDQSFILAKDNSSAKKYSDGGDRFEAILFGKKLEILYIGGNHFLFDIENWNLSLEKFQKKFKQNNIKKPLNILKKESTKIKEDNCIKILFNNINYDNLDKSGKVQSIKTRIFNVDDPQAINCDGKR